MSSGTRLLKRAAVVGALAGAGVIAAVSPAHASLAWCAAWTDDGISVGAVCYGSRPSGYRARAICYKWSTGQYATRYGQWYWADELIASTAYCPSGYEVASAEYDSHE
jgi:hypothetical protein